MLRHIKENQLLDAKVENLNRLAQYLGIDTTGLDKDETVQVVFRRIMFETTLALNMDRGYTVRDTRAR